MTSTFKEYHFEDKLLSPMSFKEETGGTSQ